RNEALRVSFRAARISISPNAAAGRRKRLEYIQRRKRLEYRMSYELKQRTLGACAADRAKPLAASRRYPPGVLNAYSLLMRSSWIAFASMHSTSTSLLHHAVTCELS